MYTHTSLSQEVGAINKCLKATMAKYEPRHNMIVKAMKHNVLGTSKRLRPLIMLQVSKVEHNDPRNIMLSACGMELIRSASLIFDDLPCMDNATLRRNRPALHMVFGEATAILTGLSLLFEGVKMIVQNASRMRVRRAAITGMLVELFDSIGIEGMIAGNGRMLLRQSAEWAKVLSWRHTERRRPVCSRSRPGLHVS